jgi:hypothetical protein
MNNSHLANGREHQVCRLKHNSTNLERLPILSHVRSVAKNRTCMPGSGVAKNVDSNQSFSSIFGNTENNGNITPTCLLIVSASDYKIIQYFFKKLMFFYVYELQVFRNGYSIKLGQRLPV